MTLKYKLFNPNNGEYTEYISKEELAVGLAEAAYNLYLSYTHNSPYSVVIQNDDGSETWQNPQGETILSPKDVKKHIEEQFLLAEK